MGITGTGNIKYNIWGKIRSLCSTSSNKVMETDVETVKWKVVGQKLREVDIDHIM